MLSLFNPNKLVRNVHILEMRKLRLKEDKYVIQDNSAYMQRGWKHTWSGNAKAWNLLCHPT